MSEYSYDVPRRHRTREPDYVTETTYIERGGRGGGAVRDLVYRPAREDSIEDIPRDFPPPGGAEYRQTKYREEYAPRRTRSVNRDYGDDNYTRYDRGRRPRDRDYDEYSDDYDRRPKPSRRKSIVEQVKEFGEAAGLGGVIGAVTGRSRSRSRRRRDDRGYDSDRNGYNDERRDRRYDSRSSSRSRGGRKSEKWEQAAKAAIVAGAVEAFRSRKEPGPWTGAKGQRVATAALGAAGIDGLIDRDPSKHDKRHVAEAALGGLVASRLANGSRSQSHPRGRGGSRSPSRSRSRSRSIFGRSRSRGRSHSREGEHDGNPLAKIAGTGAVLAAGKALYNRVRSKSRARREGSRERDSSSDSYVPSRRGNRRSYSQGRN